MKRLALITASLGASLMFNAPAQEAPRELIDLESGISQELDQALGEYNDLLAEIESEKIELVRAANDLENRIIEYQTRSRTAETELQQWRAQVQEADETLKDIRAQSEYVDGVLRAFVGAFPNHMDVAEQQLYLMRLRELGEEERNPDAAYDDKIVAQLNVAELAIDRLQQVVGGYAFEGRAIDPKGDYQDGTVVLFGPASYFVSQDATQAGILQYNANTIEPKFTRPTATLESMIKDFAREGSGVLPLDPSRKALSMSEASGTFWQHIRKGGWVGSVIIALGLLATILSVIKFFDLKKHTPKNPGNVRRIATQAKRQARASRENLLQGADGYVAAMLGAGIDNIDESPQLLEESMLSVILEYRLKLERFVPILAMTAATAPLLGLLGTVVGMIKTFTLITVFGTGDARSLSSGISEALVTTELGLIIAVPALVLHGMFQRMIKARTAELESIAFDFVKVATTNRDAHD